MHTEGGISLIEALGLGDARLISICGAGGKTTLMFTLAQMFVDQGKRVLITTTTKIAKEEAEDNWPAIVASTADEVIELYSEQIPENGGALIATTGRAKDPIKLGGLAPEEIDLLKESGAFDRILVEADGSRRLPLKAPAPYEPVVPSLTDLHIIVAGLNGLREPLGENTLFRAEIWAELTGTNLGDPVMPEALAAVVLHKGGLAKGCPPGTRNVLFLNRSSSLQRLLDAKEVFRKLSDADGPKPATVVAGWLLPEPGISEIIDYLENA